MSYQIAHIRCERDAVSVLRGGQSCLLRFHLRNGQSENDYSVVAPRGSSFDIECRYGFICHYCNLFQITNVKDGKIIHWESLISSCFTHSILRKK